MSCSCQDLQVRVQVIEEKVDFILQAIRVAKREGTIAPKLVQKSLLEVYRELKAAPAPSLIVPSTPPMDDSHA